MRILALVAGMNEPSNADTLAHAFLDGCRTVSGTETSVLRLREYPMEHFSLKFYDPKTDQGPEFETLKKAVLAADAVLIASPIWNFSVPAHLKNALDRFGQFTLDSETHSRGQLKGKPFFFLFTGAAPTPVWKGILRFTTMHLPEAIRYFGGSVVGKMFEGKAMVDKATFGLVMDKRPDALVRARSRGERFARFVEKFERTGTLPTYYRFILWSYEKGKRLISKF
jgi:multimeric flavodoxin WrbA